jgi:hypothetical protein
MVGTMSRTWWGYRRPVRRDPVFWVVGSLVLAFWVGSILVARPGPADAVLRLAGGTVSGTIGLGVLAGSVREFLAGLREGTPSYPAGTAGVVGDGDVGDRSVA